MIVEVLDNVLASTLGKEAESDEVGVAIITSAENYGRYLLGEKENVSVIDMENIG